jgi:hypothetical protein
MPNLDLSDDEHVALMRLVKHALDTDRFSDVAVTVSTPGDPREAGAQPLLEALSPRVFAPPKPASTEPILLWSLSTAPQFREAGADYHSDIGTGRVPDDRSQALRSGAVNLLGLGGRIDVDVSLRTFAPSRRKNTAVALQLPSLGHLSQRLRPEHLSFSRSLMLCFP